MGEQSTFRHVPYIVVFFKIISMQRRLMFRPEIIYSTMEHMI